MTKEQLIKEITEICAKGNPEIKKLGFGCRFLWQETVDTKHTYRVISIFGTEDILSDDTEINGFSMRAVNETIHSDIVTFDNPQDYEDGQTFYDFAEILGRDITLEDVLMAIEKSGKSFCVLSNGELRPVYRHESASWELGDYLENTYIYDLGKPLHLQDLPIIQFIHNLLTK